MNIPLKRRFVTRQWSRVWRLAWLLLLLPLPAIAWNAGGHRLIAAIAWDQLDDASRSDISRLLHAHPDYSRWLRRAVATASEQTEIDRTAFIESSTWPDDIRQDRRFYDADRNPATPPVAGFPDMERHRDWHFINRPLETTTSTATLGENTSGQLDRQLEVLAALLGRRGTASSERAYALPWLIHLVGDAHQPLHACSLPETDNFQQERISVTHFYRSRPQSSTLHAFWDDLPGPPWLRGERLNDAYRALLARYPRPRPSRPAEWIEESWQIAKHKAFPAQTASESEINGEFLEQARDIADRRVTEAGYRLAELLRQSLSGTR